MLSLIGDFNRCVEIAESIRQAVMLDKAYSYVVLKLEAAHSWGTYGVHVIILLVSTLVFLSDLD